MNVLITIPLVFAGLTLLWLVIKLFLDYISYRIEKNKREKQYQVDIMAATTGIAPTPIKQNWFKKIMTHKVQSKLDYGLGVTLGIMIMVLVMVAQPMYPFVKVAIHGGSLYDPNVDREVVDDALKEMPTTLNKYVYAIKYSIDDYAGEYNGIFDSIDIRSYSELRYVLIHEIGHRIWFKMLSSEQRKSYVEMSKEELPITEYSKTNVKEDFAEAFACYYDYFEGENYHYGCRINYNQTKRIKWMAEYKATWE